MISKTRRQMLLTTASLGAASMAPAALAQSAYPSKTIRYIVPVAAGGGADMIGRATCERLAKVLGQSLVIENISGGGGAMRVKTWRAATQMDTPCCNLMWPHTAHRLPRANFLMTPSKTLHRWA